MVFSVENDFAFNQDVCFFEAFPLTLVKKIRQSGEHRKKKRLLKEKSQRVIGWIEKLMSERH